METLPCPDDNSAKSNQEIEQWQKHPKMWFKKRFPELFKKYNGNVVNVMTRKDNVYFVQELNEDFLAETLGEMGNPASPTLYAVREDRFYRYEPEAGIFMSISENQIVADLSRLLQLCAQECEQKGFCDTTSLRYHLSKAAQLGGVIKKARGYLRVPESYFDTTVQEYIACENGMLRLADMQLVDFSPIYRRRNKLSVAYDPNAQCPIFLNTLMRQSLEEEDILFLQQWVGLALLGRNLPHAIVILYGMAGSGKSTFVKIIIEIIGRENVYTLRTDKLGEKFETSFYLGKTLLQGVDVATDFLTNKSATALKALTGGDIMNVEVKYGVMGGPEIEGNFNVIIICNSLPNIRLEGDVDAWRRRLKIIPYRKPKPHTVNATLADSILKEEGSGVLNWGLDGLAMLRKANWCFTLTESQLSLLDRVLLQSDNLRQFVKHSIVKDENSKLMLDDCFSHYLDYCNKQEWEPFSYREAMPKITSHILKTFGVTQIHDIRDDKNKAQRGWNGIKVK